MVYPVLVVLLLYIISFFYLFHISVHPEKFVKYPTAKAVQSLLFLCLFLASLRVVPNNGKEYFLFIALLLAALGDIVIGLANKRHGANNAGKSKTGLLGVSFFSVAHVFYLFWLNTFLPLQLSYFIIPLIVMLLMAIIITRLAVFHFSKSTRIYAILYYTIVSFMASYGVRVYLSLRGINAVLFGMIGLASLLFFLSDVLMLFLYFMSDKKCPRWVRPVNLGTYYLAQALFACSICFIY